MQHTYSILLDKQRGYEGNYSASRKSKMKLNRCCADMSKKQALIANKTRQLAFKSTLLY